jgi:hypothetical protein
MSQDAVGANVVRQQRLHPKGACLFAMKSYAVIRIKAYVSRFVNRQFCA